MTEEASAGLNDVEREVASELLSLASDQFANHGCNDYTLDNTDANWALVVAAETWSSGSCDRQRPSGDLIYSEDFLLMSYLAHRLADG